MSGFKIYTHLSFIAWNMAIALEIMHLMSLGIDNINLQ